MKTKKRVPVKRKYTNEAKEEHVYEECSDPWYLSQIIDRIGC